MTSKEQLIEQHIREYESRLKHIDELFQRAQAATEQPDDKRSAGKLRDFAAQRALLQQTADHIKSMPMDHWREETVRAAGPMAVWDIYAQTLEDFIERHE